METIEFNGQTYTFDTVREWNLKVIEADLPVKGCCCPWDEGSKEYRIFINKNLSDQEKRKTFVHELIHIYNGDFDHGEDIQTIEARTHRQTEEIMKKLEY